MGKFFIQRPIFATVISILITLAGLASVGSLPVEQFPKITPPQVVVSATYPGASAVVVEKTVASVLEDQINGVENMLYMNSTSSNNGGATVTITFEIGTNVDQAAIDVSNRVKVAEPILPDEVRRRGVQIKKRSGSFLLITALEAKDSSISSLELSNYASLNVVDELKRVNGVGDINLFGGKDYSIRIWLKPDKMSVYNISVADVIRKIREQNAFYAIGKVGDEPSSKDNQFTLTVTSKTDLVEPKDFGEIIILPSQEGSALKLKDIANIELGARSYDSIPKLNNKEAILIGVFPQPDANLLEVASNVYKKMDELSKRFPDNIGYVFPYDTSLFIKISIKEVIKTLIEAMILVIAVIYLFLQNWRATIIPCVAIPVCIIGSFLGIYLFGMSINTLTLFALVLAIGIVVDDAIIVLENTERIMAKEKLPAKQASIKAIGEVTSPVIATVLILCAVFIPVAFVEGLAGALYKQFAITISIAVVISGVVALTLTPVMCSLFLKPHDFVKEKKDNLWNKFFSGFNNFFEKLTSGYVRFTAKSSTRGMLMFVLFLLVIGLSAMLFKFVPKGFLPAEDQGYMILVVQMPDAASIGRTQKVVEKLVEDIRQNNAIERVVSFSGFDLFSGSNKSSSATLWIRFKHWDERGKKEQSLDAIFGDVVAKAAKYTEINAIPIKPPTIIGFGLGGFEMYLQNKGEGGIEALNEAVGKIQKEVPNNKQLTFASSTLRTNVPQVSIQVEKSKAKALFVEIEDIFLTLQGTLGVVYVNDFNKFGRNYRVQLQADKEYRDKIENLNKIFVKSTKGQMIPISNLVTVKYSTGPDVIDRFNGFTSAKIIGGTTFGVSSSTAIDIMEKIANENLSKQFDVGWSGVSFQEKQNKEKTNTSAFFAVIAIFLILAALYESWRLPFVVILSVPFALLGALLAVFITGLENDIYFQIGLITLIGLATRNAILIVEFAENKRAEGFDPLEAALRACYIRFRPIVMTSLAFILGVLPLVFSSGAGSNSRQAIGTGIVGGMIFATFIAIIFIPIFYYWLSSKNKPSSRQKNENN